MKISKSSWHYKLYRYVTNIPSGPQYLNPFGRDLHRTDKPIPRSLCPYAWSIFLGLVGSALMCLGLAIAAAVAALPYGGYRLLKKIDSYGNPFKFKKGERKPKLEKPEKLKQPSLVASFVKAKKDKVCPMIELVD